MPKKIYIYIFAELKNNLEDKITEEYLMLLEKFPTLEKQFSNNWRGSNNGGSNKLSTKT